MTSYLVLGAFDKVSAIPNTKVFLLAIFIIVAISFSLFYGNKAADIFVDDFRAFNKRKMKIKAWEFHLFWVNFISSLFGWATLFYLAMVRFAAVRNLFRVKIGFPDIVLIFIALFGITGVLGHILSKASSVK